MFFFMNITLKSNIISRDSFCFSTVGIKIRISRRTVGFLGKFFKNWMFFMSSSRELFSTSHLYGGNAPYLEELYESYLGNPNSISEFWREYFDRLQAAPASDGNESTHDQPHKPVVRSFYERSKSNVFSRTVSSETDFSIASKQIRIQSLITAYRSIGSFWANVDPLDRQEHPEVKELDPEFHGLAESDLDQTFSISNTYSLLSSDKT